MDSRKGDYNNHSYSHQEPSYSIQTRMASRVSVRDSRERNDKEDGYQKHLDYRQQQTSYSPHTSSHHSSHHSRSHRQESYDRASRVSTRDSKERDYRRQQVSYSSQKEPSYQSHPH